MDMLRQTAWAVFALGLLALMMALCLGLCAPHHRRSRLRRRVRALQNLSLLRSPADYLSSKHVRTFRHLVNLGFALWATGALLLLVLTLRRAGAR